LQIAGVIALYWAISISMVFVNKNLLGNPTSSVDLSIFIAWVQCGATVLIGLVVQVAQQGSGATGQAPLFSCRLMLRRQILTLTCSFVGMLVFNNLCLKSVGVPFYQIARSMTLSFTVLFAVIILRQAVSARVVLCCGLVVAGFLLGVDQEKLSGTLSMRGVLFGLTTSVFIALSGIFTKQALAVVDKDSVRLTLYNNANAFVLLAPIVLGTGQAQNVIALGLLASRPFVSLLVGSSLLGFLIGWISAVQINVTSPVTHHISANAKAVAQTLIAVVYYADIKPPLWWLSVFMVVGGALAYALVRLRE
ncbi:GDP-fucose transporter 1, partial [Lamellibrachia satsuma]